jgi:hypothetical protein
MNYEIIPATQPHCATEFIPPEADALAFPHVGSAVTSSWLGFGSLLSTCELRNHFRSDPVQVQSTGVQGALRLGTQMCARGTMPAVLSGIEWMHCTTLLDMADCHSNGWAEAPIKIARMTLTIKLDGNWSSFQLANNTPPLSVTGSVIAPSARMLPAVALYNQAARARAWQ